MEQGNKEETICEQDWHPARGSVLNYPSAYWVWTEIRWWSGKTGHSWTSSKLSDV